MRAREYPGSDIAVEQVLDPGVNYSRYYVSYLSEGLKIYALMTVPNAEKPATGWPVVIFNHGYIPPSVYRTTERYVAYVDLIARSGYIVFRSDYRGHDQSEGEAGGAYSRPDYTVDVLNAVASMKRYPDADPNRMGMWGHSMGGYITLRSMVISKDIKAGVVWGGVVASYPDMLTRWRRGPMYRWDALGAILAILVDQSIWLARREPHLLEFHFCKLLSQGSLRTDPT
jgi:alpha-beta hydrolase superfamily lysophospholipase